MILLTGATGFVGRNLVRELRGRSKSLICLVRNPEKASFLKEAGCEVVGGDVTRAETVENAFDGEIEAAVHLVGILTESKGASYRAVHVEGTRNVVEACRSRGVKRYLHISALGTRPGARSMYHRTKWEAEEIVRASGLDYTIFRPSVIFGPGDRFINTFAKVMRISPVIFMPGDGMVKMQTVFVGDLVRAMADSLDRADARMKVFEIAGPEAQTFNEIIDSLAGILGKRIVKVHVPLVFYRLAAAVMEAVLPRPPLTRDALLMLEEDNVTDRNALTEFFNIRPTPLVEGIRTYIH